MAIPNEKNVLTDGVVVQEVPYAEGKSMSSAISKLDTVNKLRFGVVMA